MDKVGVMVTYCDPLCVRVVHCIWRHWTTHTHNGSEYAAITPIMSMSTDTTESFLWFLTKHCTRLTDDGSSVIRNMLEHFYIFYNLLVSAYYILCISWIIKCLIIIDARCKHEYTAGCCLCELGSFFYKCFLLLSVFLLRIMFRKLREKNEPCNYMYRPTYSFFIVCIENYIARLQTSLRRL